MRPRTAHRIGSVPRPGSALREALATLERSARVGLWTYDVASDKLWWSDGVYMICGRSRDDYVPTIAGVIAHYAQSSRRALVRALRKMLREGAGFALDLQLVRADGSTLWVRLVAEPQIVAGDVVRAVGCLMDIQASRGAEQHQRVLQEQVRHQRDYDVLTRLPNRSYLERELAGRLGAARRSGAGGWLLYMDLDRFKLANEACGPVAGDRLVREVAAMLRANLEPDDFLARLHGDKFVALLAVVEPHRAMRRATALVALIDHYRFHADEHTFHLGLSMGAAPIDASVQQPGELFRRAEASCRIAKQQGGARVVVYRREDLELASSEADLGWGEEILAALDQNRFELYAQRIVDLRGQRPPGYEILLRLRSRDGSIVAPGQFLPAARRYGLMNVIDRRVVQLVLQYFAASPLSWQACEYVSVNLSGASLGDDSFVGFLLPALARSGVDPARLCFEITESEALSNMASAQEIVERLHTSGHRVFLDDFGNGFTSFHYLRSLQVQGLKLDNSYIRHLDGEPFNQAVVTSICRICDALGLELVAEGVETAAELELLRQLGVARAQGWLFHRPQPLAQGCGPAATP